MDGWIAGRIRATSLRRVVVWTLALVGFVVVATSDRRYIANFLSGPYPLARADLDSIGDVTSTPRYYARVSADRVIDTGIRQYTIHTQSGVETSREESGAYTAFVLGKRYLVVKTGADQPSVAEGKLAPWPSDLDPQLFASKEMRSLRPMFYPFYLDSDSFRRPGFVVIGIGIVFLLLFVWQTLPAWRAWRNPERHPLWKRVAQWGGDPMGIALEAEHDYENSLMRGKAGWRMGNKFLVRSTFFTFNVLRFHDVLWGYKKITRHSAARNGRRRQARHNAYTVEGPTPQIFMCRVSGISRSESSSATAGTAMEYASVRPRLCVAVQTAVVMSGTAPPPQPLPM